MEKRQPLVVQDVEGAVDEIIARVGKTIAIGLPLGLGNPAELVNALYRRAAADPAIQLRILTALSLEKPRGASSLESAFLEPFVERIYGDCPDLEYLASLRADKLPPNIQVCEFFFRPGSQLDSKHAQQHYISSNYTHAARDVFNQGCNVAAQMVAKREVDGQVRYSLSCNPDTSPELAALLRASGRPHLTVALVNQNLPYMFHDAEVEPGFFDLVLDHPRHTTTLFSTPKLAVTVPDYLIGLQASALVRDGGTLQVGIGALGDAVVQCLRLRHEHNAAYRSALQDCGVLARSQALIHDSGGLAPFEKGLYGASEMLVDGFVHLQRAGILKREVYDFWALQQLVNDGRCDPQALRPAVLDGLEALGVRALRGADFEILQHHGLFTDDTRYEAGYLVAADGERAIANVADPAGRALMQRCLGARLRNGLLLHGAFFLGPSDFYQALRDMPDEERRQIAMTGVYKVNQLDHNPRLYKAQRRDARFINTGIMVTLSGAVCSDGLADGRVISGVGGQFNFVDMAQHLPDARAILLIRGVRDKEGKTQSPSSNIVFNYGHITIPRHLRDIVITEYGIADLRSKTDADVAKALIQISDVRFQDELLHKAQAAGKIEPCWKLPDACRNNTPAALAAKLAPYQRQGHFPAFPLGCDFTPEELVLGKALRAVKARVGKGRLRALLDAWRVREIPAAAQPFLERLQLTRPSKLQDRVAQRLLVLELQAAGAI